MGLSEWGPIRCMLALAPILLGAPLYGLYLQYSLPTPNIYPFDPRTALPHPSETTVLSYAKYLSEDIGYRIPGTREHAMADEWLLQKVQEISELCHKVVAKEPGRKLECKVWRQQGSGSHRFDMMSARLYKTYVDLSNIILQISDGTNQSKSDTVLINSHLDSTLPSPGAADDALAVGVMLECARVLVQTPGWVPTHAIIFLFNNAEECLQDGSHLYSTQHETAPTVRAVVNLEAAGTTGPELLFQATSEQMIEAYSHVPRPYGSVIANEIFNSGILLSDTDFRQFEEYLNVTGLDIAIVGNSYMYHMRGDLVENIQPGVAQHMADNVLALLRYLSSDVSPIPSLANGFARPRTVFLNALQFFLVYSFTTAKVLYVALFMSSLVLLRVARVARVWTGFGAVVAAMVGSLVGANMVAFVMKYMLKKPLSWFKAEYHPVLLYGPAAMTGMLLTQLLFSNAGPKVATRTLERSVFAALLLFQSFLAAFGQLINIGSSAAAFLGSVGFFVALCVDTVLIRTGIQRFQRNRNVGHIQRVTNGMRHQAIDDGRALSLWAYAIAMFIPLTSGVQMLASTLIVFVPLTGRIGGDAPAEFIIASIVAVLGSFCLSSTAAFVHRFAPHVLRLAVLSSIVALGVSMAFFYGQNPFDRQHQKRLFVVHNEDLMRGDQHLHIAAADGTPGFDDLAYEIAFNFGTSGVPPKAMVMDDYNSDWDILYPFSAFLSPYKIDLPHGPTYVSAKERFTVRAVSDSINKHAETRRLTLQIDHPGIIWTVIAFDAHVLEWTLDNNPPNEFARHHIKEASFYGISTWNVSMTIKYPPPAMESGPGGWESATLLGLKIKFIGIEEKRMWPAKMGDANESPVMKLFKELDEWLEVRLDGSVDATMLGCVSGETVV